MLIQLRAGSAKALQIMRPVDAALNRSCVNLSKRVRIMHF